MRKLLIIAAFGVGYVVGTKAGRQRYEQIKRLSRQVADNPKVQGVAGLLEAQAEGVVDTVRAKVLRDPAGDL
ncbi:hypothetical protein [Cumulibacter soli]|uniref:hypothetical protein n=1 Tax=Cumulibacter soli TaxID=2546344 RepID=UPI0010681228|nr:hypothetical protein [Cumulibacter soli]